MRTVLLAATGLALLAAPSAHASYIAFSDVGGDLGRAARVVVVEVGAARTTDLLPRKPAQDRGPASYGSDEGQALRRVRITGRVVEAWVGRKQPAVVDVTCKEPIPGAYAAEGSVRPAPVRGDAVLLLLDERGACTARFPIVDGDVTHLSGSHWGARAPRDEVRRAAVAVAAFFRDVNGKPVEQLVARGLLSDDDAVRYHALLHRREPSRIFPKEGLVKALRETKARAVRGLAAQRLAEVDRGALSQLVPTIDDDAAREALWAALLDAPPEEQQRVHLLALDDDAPQIRSRAARKLIDLAKSGQPPPGIDEALLAVARRMDLPQTVEITDAAQVLLTRGDLRGLDALVDVVRDPSRAAPGAAEGDPARASSLFAWIRGAVAFDAAGIAEEEAQRRALLAWYARERPHLSWDAARRKVAPSSSPRAVAPLEAAPSCAAAAPSWAPLTLSCLLLARAAGRARRKGGAGRPRRSIRAGRHEDMR